MMAIRMAPRLYLFERNPACPQTKETDGCATTTMAAEMRMNTPTLPARSSVVAMMAKLIRFRGPLLSESVAIAPSMTRIVVA